MIATELMDAGFEDLVSVIPPDGKLAPSSNVQEDQRGKCPGILTSNGWVGYSFTKDKVAAEALDKWGSNIGLLGTRFPGLDIDCEDQELTDSILLAAKQFLGPTCVRLSRGARRLLVYTTTEPFNRMALLLTYKGHTHMVEWLGQGRQYLVYGRHPSGSVYGWEPDGPVAYGHLTGPLWAYTPEDLPVVDREKAAAFLHKLADVYSKHGVECEVVGDGRTREDKAPPQDDLRAPSEEKLREVVGQIPNTNVAFPERDDYIRMGHAIKAAGGDEALFVEWALTWEGNEKNPDGNDEATVRADWQRMQPPYRVGWSWLVEQAENLGTYSSAQDEFEADMSLLEEESDEETTELQEAPPNVSDEELAATVLKTIGWKLRYVSLNKQWHIWNNYAWAPDELNGVFDLVLTELRKLRDVLLDHARNANNKAAKKQLRANAAHLQQRKTLENVVVLLSYSREVNVRPRDFDDDPWVLNTPGKLILLHDEGIEIRKNDARFMCARSTAVAPAAGEPTLWLKFLHEATGGDEELQAYLQKFVGYCLSGSTDEMFLPFIWGRSKTGKSVFVKTIAGMFGSYWKPASLEMFQATRDSRHPAELAELAGARLVTASETQEGRVWDEQRIKAVTSGDPMQVHKKYGHPFTLYPTFKLIVTGNHEPTIKNPDDAMQNRIHVVPLDNVVPVEDRDEALVYKLKREWPQILRWALEGYAMWRRDKLVPPACVLQRTKVYFSEEDLVGQWLEEACELGAEFETGRNALYASWEEWCNRHGAEPGGFKTFRRKLRPYGFGEVQIGTERVKGNRGLRLRAPEGYYDN